MNGKETAQAAMEEQQYQRSEQARFERFVDKQRRAVLDFKAGHASDCDLMKCSPNCKRAAK